MKKLFAIFGIAACLLAGTAHAELDSSMGHTNEVLTVNQDNELSVSGVASVQDIARAAAAAELAVAKAQVAEETATQVTNAIQLIVDNIMSNRVVIYRRGYVDSFSALTVLTDTDRVIITGADWVERTAERIVCNLRYVCTADVSALKPNVYTHNTLENSTKLDFEMSDDMNVTDPEYIQEPVVLSGNVFEGYYRTTVTIPNPVSDAQYFLFIKLEGNDPGGTGAELILPNGVKGGITGEVTFGNKIITFNGGLVSGVADVQQ